MSESHLSVAALERRRFWVSEIVKISGQFGEDSSRVERELTDEVTANGTNSIVDHLRMCGTIPEQYGPDSSEEKLYSKYTDALLAVAFRQLGLAALVLTERADAADVEVVATDYSFVADAKAFRLSRTAKNQKDFKVQAMDTWKHGKKYALLVAPLYQLPNRSSQIYYQAISRDVCVFSYAHLAILLRLAQAVSPEASCELLHKVLQRIATLNPGKDSNDYWREVNSQMLQWGSVVEELWHDEKAATIEALTAAKEEGLTFLASERERIMRLSHEEAISQLIGLHRLDSRAVQISRVVEGGLLDIRLAAPS